MIAALFVRHDSIYKTFPDVECYDLQRNARTFRGGMPVIAHPPCRTWGKLRQFATLAPPEEHTLALWAVEKVRTWGGILEHPEGSTLWKEAQLPRLLQATRDYLRAGTDYSLRVDQFWWGHRARKRTWLYVHGIPLQNLPPLPIVLGMPSHGMSGMQGKKPEIPPNERDQTPPALAQWLIAAVQSLASSGGLGK